MIIHATFPQAIYHTFGPKDTRHEKKIDCLRQSLIFKLYDVNVDRNASFFQNVSESEKMQIMTAVP